MSSFDGPGLDGPTFDSVAGDFGTGDGFGKDMFGQNLVRCDVFGLDDVSSQMFRNNRTSGNDAAGNGILLDFGFTDGILFNTGIVNPSMVIETGCAILSEDNQSVIGRRFRTAPFRNVTHLHAQTSDFLRIRTVVNTDGAVFDFQVSVRTGYINDACIDGARHQFGRGQILDGCICNNGITKECRIGDTCPDYRIDCRNQFCLDGSGRQSFGHDIIEGTIGNVGIDGIDNQSANVVRRQSFQV